MGDWVVGEQKFWVGFGLVLVGLGWFRLVWFVLGWFWLVLVGLVRFGLVLGSSFRNKRPGLSGRPPCKSGLGCFGWFSDLAL